MKKEIYNIKGIKDILSPKIYLWNYLENKLISLIKSYGYEEIRIPLIEKTILFTKSIGKNTDIIEKEMFSFIDKNDKSITLRPEGTVGCIKSLMTNGLIRNIKKNRIWYIGPMFRRENPQQGRHRQFYQFGIEATGFQNNNIDLEHIIIINKIFKLLNLENISLEINCIGNNNDIKNYEKKIINYFKNYENTLTSLNKNRLENNPIKILDDKDINIKFKNIPPLINDINSQSQKKFINIIYNLKKLNIKFKINYNLVRGLDYYNDIVYEWTSKINNKKMTICAGGRYDGLSQQLGGEKTFSNGCAIGLDRLLLLLDNKLKFNKNIDGYIIFLNDKPLNINIKISEKIRKYLPELVIINHYDKKKITKQITKTNPKFILGINEQDVKNKTVTITDLITNNEKTVPIKHIKKYITY